MKKIKGGITAVCDIQTAGLHCGIKSDKNKKDLALIYSKTPARAAALFTTNKLKGAPLIVTNEHLQASEKIQAIIINSGNANACTGKQGLEDAKAMTQITAKEMGIPIESVLVASTGVIGELLPMDRIEKGIKELVKSLSKESKDAAQAILTTDTKPKEVAVEFRLSNGICARIAGMAKGAGMICPHLATMLVFIATDVAITQELLKKALVTSINKSFNLMTIDGDTSPNDMVVILANGLAGNKEITSPALNDFETFQQTLDWVCLSLAKKIIKNGEGVTKLLKIKVRGAKTLEEAKQVAMTIAKSHLVKCAFYGHDPNWGRIMTACGYAGVELNPQLIDIFVEKELIVRAGEGQDFDFDKMDEILNKKEILITIDLNQGNEEIRVLGCDLSGENIFLNAHYMT